MRPPSLIATALLVALGTIGLGCTEDDPADEVAAAIPASVEAPPGAAVGCDEVGGALAAGLADDGLVYCLGDELLSGTAVESSGVRNADPGGWTIDLVFAPGADGIDAFNTSAIECFNASPVCPTGQLAVVVSGGVVTAPTINASGFERDQIVVTGSFTEDEATRIADDLIADGSFRPVLFTAPTTG